MTKAIMLTVIAMAASPAFASKARMTALGNAAHLTDTRTIFAKPSDAATMGSLATFEWGTNTTATSTTVGNAEGGFIRQMGDASWGFHLGHKNDWVTANRAAAAATNLTEENPIDLYYAAKAGDLTWGVGLWYSNSDKKTTGKQSSNGLRAGVNGGMWDAGLTLGLTDTAEIATGKYTGSTKADISAGMWFDELYAYLDYEMNGYKFDNAAGTTTSEVAANTMKLGVIHMTKVEGGQFFYGAEYNMYNYDDKKVTSGNSKKANQTLPFIAGLEVDAASWLGLRASVKQNILLSSIKTGNGDALTTNNDTTVAAGAALKFGKMTVDGTLEGAGDNTAALNGNKLLASVGMTYMF